jgi:hypothetical protein
VTVISFCFALCFSLFVCYLLLTLGFSFLPSIVVAVVAGIGEQFEGLCAYCIPGETITQCARQVYQVKVEVNLYSNLCFCFVAVFVHSFI